MEEPKIVKQDQWRTSMDGYTQARVSFGHSQEGHHYRLDVSTYNHDNSGDWSLPIRSEKGAQQAGFAAVARALDEGPERARDRVPQTERGQHAKKLDNAAEMLRFSLRASGSGRPQVAQQYKREASSQLAEAAWLRPEHQGQER